MDELDIRLLRAVQDGLKLTKRPYQNLGEELGMSEDEVIKRLGALVEEGVIRRFAAAIGHRAPGNNGQCYDCMEGSNAGYGKDRSDRGLIRGRHPLLCEGGSTRVALQPLCYGPFPQQGRVREDRIRDLKGRRD